MTKQKLQKIKEHVRHDPECSIGNVTTHISLLRQVIENDALTKENIIERLTYIENYTKTTHELCSVRLKK